MRLASLSPLALLLCAPALAASPGQADICHWDDTTDTAAVITVSVKAVSAHFTNHGDSYAAIYFSDADGDGYGDAAGTTDRCPNAGFADNNTDCDDADAGVNPGATEVPYDGVDNDCAEGTRDDDLDNDGFGQADDCDDANDAVNPAEEDVCDDGLDNNCDGSIDENCVGDCPCFTSADIDAAYAAHLAVEQPYADYNRAYSFCQEITYDETYDSYSYHQDYTQVYFDAFSGDYTNDYYYNYWVAYEGSYAGFYGVSYEQSYDGGGYELAYCNNYQNNYSYDGSTYTNDYSQVYVQVTDAEAEACEAVVVAWAVDNSMSCPVYSYVYSY